MADIETRTKKMERLETPVGNVIAETCDGSFYGLDGKTLNVSLERDGLVITLAEVTCDPENKELRIVLLDPNSQRNLTQICFVVKESSALQVTGIDNIFEKLNKQIEENKTRGKYKSVFEIEETYASEDKRSYIVNHLLADEEDKGLFDNVIEKWS